MFVSPVIHATLLATLAAGPGDPPPAPTFDHPSDRSSDRPSEAGPRRTIRAGGALMGTGGVLMVVGAAVLVPLGVARAARAEQPDPRDYTAVEPFRQDMLAYRDTVERSMTLGLAGSVTAVVGATAFVAGAITWGVGRRRLRRTHLSLQITPGPRGAHASLGGRF